MSDPLPEILITGDGSPTMLWRFPGGRAETMHSRDGAFSETDYIYGAAVRLLAERNWPAKILSVGLGLGYNEILAAALCPRIDHMLSFEKDLALRRNILDWTAGEDSPKTEVYRKIAELTAEKTAVSAEQIRFRLQELSRTGGWRVMGELDLDVENPRYHALLYDAFSSYSQPELWQAEHMAAFIDRFAESRCVFATYACTGVLKKALKAKGFQLTRKKGFSYKREATFAVRA